MAEPHRISKEALRLRLRAISTAWSMAEAVIEPSVEVITETDLRGNDSHGIAMIPFYAEMRRKGHLTMPPCDPALPVSVADDPEDMAYVHCLENGVPIPKMLIQAMAIICRGANNEFLLHEPSDTRRMPQ